MQHLFLIPTIMAPVAIGTLWRMMLDSTTGIINYFLSFFGVPSITWLSSPKTAMLAVIFSKCMATCTMGYDHLCSRSESFAHKTVWRQHVLTVHRME
ncbi:MAG: hypothetical protein ACLSGB_12950 [Dorea sp.]